MLGHDDVVGGQPEPVGEVVERLGGVAADDRDVVPGAAVSLIAPQSGQQSAERGEFPL
jgi:hypothetical protein